MTPTGSTMANSANAALTSSRMSMPCIIAARAQRILSPAKHQIPHPVPQTDAALLELGERAGVGARWRNPPRYWPAAASAPSTASICSA